MGLAKSSRKRLGLAARGKREGRTQFGALCWRRGDGGVEILLVTTRKSRRWMIPKGWPVHGVTPEASAAVEAWEEAGAKGRPDTTCLGVFSYFKGGRGGLPCVVAVFPLKVRRMADKWPEKSQRKRRWVTARKAATMVEEPELRAILRAFDPDRI